MTLELDILVVGAHPDDAELTCGGTIAHYKKMGKKVGILDLSNGEPTPRGSVETRMIEADKAAKILNVDIRITLDMTNRYIENTIEGRKKVGDIFRKYRPKVIITHPPRDWHPDHIACHWLVNAAKFQAKLTKTESPYPEFYPPRILYFDGSHINERRLVDFCVDISDSIEDKIKALECYETQFLKGNGPRDIFEYIKERAGYLGFQIGVRYAEGFICPEFYQIKDITEI